MDSLLLHLECRVYPDAKLITYLTKTIFCTARLDHSIHILSGPCSLDSASKTARCSLFQNNYKFFEMSLRCGM